MEIYHQLKIYEISTHAPAGGATLRGLIILGAIYDFYSRPCGRGDKNAFREFGLYSWISTHAPAGGATLPPTA